MNYTIYSKPNCPQCDQAKILLTSRSIPYNEIVLDVGQSKVEGKTYISVIELKTMLPTAKSVPQIFRGDKYIGGLTELREKVGSST